MTDLSLDLIDLRAELDAMTAERDFWKLGSRDVLAELRKVAEELGALKGDRDKWKTAYTDALNERER